MEHHLTVRTPLADQLHPKHLHTFTDSLTCFLALAQVGISALTVVAAPIAEKLHPTRPVSTETASVFACGWSAH